MDAEAINPLGYKDFDRFGAWYSRNRRRTHGREASPHTLRTKQVWCAAVANIYGVSEEVLLGKLLADRGEVERVIARLETRLTPGSLRQAVYALKDFGDYAVANGWIEGHEVHPDDIPSKNPQAPITVYSPAEMDLFMSAARGYDLRWWAFICFLAETGRRVGEALNLRWDWFRLEAGVPHIELPLTKNGDPQYIPLTKHLRTEVFTPENVAKLKVQNKRGRMAFGRDPQEFPFPWSYGAAHDRMERFCARVGLPNRGFHCFRHTVITDRIARGVPIQAVAALAGHRSVATTMSRYNHTNALHFSRFVEPESGGDDGLE